MQPANKGNIIAVDDSSAYLKLLEGMLRPQGYQVRSFSRGRLALAAAAENPPELILLDINMPEMSGYEVCECLKANEKLAQIPVIFLSALDEAGDKVKAFQCGGVDYVTKPFQLEEVQARVETHIALQLEDGDREDAGRDRRDGAVHLHGREVRVGDSAGNRDGVVAEEIAVLRRLERYGRRLRVERARTGRCRNRATVLKATNSEACSSGRARESSPLWTMRCS